MRNLLCKAISLVTIMALPVPVLAQDVVGVWRTEETKEGHLEIKISPCAAALCGRIVGARNADGVTGPYEHMDKLMIRDMKADAEAGSWSGGTIWDPRRDRTFNSRMSLENGRLKVAGCVLGVCQSQIWSRVR